MIRFGWLEFLIVLAIVLLIFGPGRIEKGARWLGSALRSLRERLFGSDHKGE